MSRRPQEGGDSICVNVQLTRGVRHVFGNNQAFVAVKDDGFVVMWSNPCDCVCDKVKFEFFKEFHACPHCDVE